MDDEVMQARPVSSRQLLSSPGSWSDDFSSSHLSQGYDVVGMDDDGFPKLQTMDGEEKLVKGNNFVVRCACFANAIHRLADPFRPAATRARRCLRSTRRR